ncbi:MAG: WD40 repeat domain-containing protein, partial [Myxococcales bacterium]|nr:WD40 repeat domain-containing protein [Myxococcales bacterium]
MRVWGSDGRELFHRPPEDVELQRDVALTPDGAMVLWLADRVVHAHTLVDGQERYTLRANNPAPREPDLWADSFALSPDGGTVAIAYHDTTIRLFRTVDGELVEQLGQPLAVDSFPKASDVERMRYAPDGRRIVVSVADGSVATWDLATKAVVHRFEPGLGAEPIIAVSEDAIACVGSEVRIHGLADGKERLRFSPRGAVPHTAAFTPDGERLLVGSETGPALLSVYDVKRGTLVGLRRGPLHTAAAVFVADDGTVHAAVGNALLRWQPGAERHAPSDSPTSATRAVVFTADGKSLLAGGDDGEVWQWDLASKARVGRFAVDDADRGVNAIFDRDDWKTASVAPVRAIVPFGDRLVTVHASGSTRTWSLATRQVTDGAIVQRYAAMGAVRHGDHILIAGRDDEGDSIKIWDPRRRETEQRLDLTYRNLALTPVLRPDGEELAIDDGGTLRFWDLRRRAPVASLEPEHAVGSTALAYAPDGSRFVNGDGYGFLRLWDLKTRTELRHRLDREEGGWASAAFTPDGASLVAGKLRGGGLLVLDATTLEPRRRLEGHAGAVGAIVVSQD